MGWCSDRFCHGYCTVMVLLTLLVIALGIAGHVIHQDAITNHMISEPVESVGGELPTGEDTVTQGKKIINPDFGYDTKMDGLKFGTFGAATLGVLGSGFNYFRHRNDPEPMDFGMGILTVIFFLGACGITLWMLFCPVNPPVGIQIFLWTLLTFSVCCTSADVYNREKEYEKRREPTQSSSEEEGDSAPSLPPLVGEDKNPVWPTFKKGDDAEVQESCQWVTKTSMGIQIMKLKKDAKVTVTRCKKGEEKVEVLINGQLKGWMRARHLKKAGEAGLTDEERRKKLQQRAKEKLFEDKASILDTLVNSGPSSPGSSVRRRLNRRVHPTMLRLLEEIHQAQVQAL